MHHIYHTEGFILASRPRGEANKMLVIYTKDFGLLHVAAQSVRHMRSRLRYALQDYSYAKIDLVRGRDVWRLTSATTIESFATLRSDGDSFALLYNIGKLIERLCMGEEANLGIFEDLLQALFFLNRPHVENKEREVTELSFVLRTLHNLGYIGQTETLTTYLSDRFTPDSYDLEAMPKKTILSEINRALRESQL